MFPLPPWSVCPWGPRLRTRPSRGRSAWELQRLCSYWPKPDGLTAIWENALHSLCIFLTRTRLLRPLLKGIHESFGRNKEASVCDFHGEAVETARFTWFSEIWKHVLEVPKAPDPGCSLSQQLDSKRKHYLSERGAITRTQRRTALWWPGVLGIGLTLFLLLLPMEPGVFQFHCHDSQGVEGQARTSPLLRGNSNIWALSLVINVKTPEANGWKEQGGVSHTLPGTQRLHHRTPRPGLARQMPLGSLRACAHLSTFSCRWAGGT